MGKYLTIGTHIVSFLFGASVVYIVMHNRELTTELAHKNEVIAIVAAAEKIKSDQIKISNDIESKYVKVKNDLDSQTKINRDLLATYRVRDNTDNSANTGSDSPNTVRETPRTGLSADDAAFLVEYARIADGAAAYANACYDWVTMLDRSQNENK